jgi:hypothetical protein
MRAKVLLVLLGLTLPQVGCKPLLYPFARAFGSPSEGDLARCRTAFERFKSRGPTAQVLVHPATDPRGPGLLGSPEATARAVAVLGFAGAQRVAEAAPVAPLALGANQMRYVWNRAHAYEAWVRQAHPTGDYALFLEVMQAPTGQVMGCHIYVVDATGQIAYTRLMNSHQFGNSLKDPTAACVRLVRQLLLDLQKPADQVFPPYGVG